RAAPLLSGADAATFAAEPLAVKQMSPSELDPQTSPRELRDRLAVVSVSDLAVAQERADTRVDTSQPAGADHARPFREPLAGELDARAVTGPGRRFCQLWHEQRSVSDRVGLHRFPRCHERKVMSAEPVVEH